MLVGKGSSVHKLKLELVQFELPASAKGLRTGNSHQLVQIWSRSVRDNAGLKNCQQ